MDAGTALHTAAACLSLGALARIGLLPRTDFRPGRRTLAWWLNAVPFWVAGTGLLAMLVRVDSPWVAGGPAAAALSVAASAAAVSAFVLIGRTSAAHERRPALWHQPADTPDVLVTTGPYAHVRHPFYAAFLLALLGCALAAPHATTLGALALGAHRLNRTAAAEEVRFLTSALGSRYADYARQVGRFLPRTWRGGRRDDVRQAPDARKARGAHSGPSGSTPGPGAGRAEAPENAASLEPDLRPRQQASEPLGQ